MATEKTTAAEPVQKRLDRMRISEVVASFTILDKDGNPTTQTEELRIEASDIYPGDKKQFGKQLVNDSNLLDEMEHQLGRLKALPPVDVSGAEAAAKRLNAFISQ